jgi:hypothetical protein
VANEGARVMAGPFAVEQPVLASIALFPRVRLHVMPAKEQRSIKGLLRTLTDPARLDALSKSGLIDSVSEKILTAPSNWQRSLNSWLQTKLMTAGYAAKTRWQILAFRCDRRLGISWSRRV